MAQPYQDLVVAEGGEGGRGNARFATAINQAPTFREEGQPGRERILRLELKIVADVGLVGLPNAGKSTLISRVSSAHPKIADYPFTTLEPVVGIVDTDGYRRFTVADLPGLIEGAHDGKGLGDEFLRHVDRTRVIVHVIDLMPMDGSDPVHNYRTIRDELRMHSEALAAKPEIVAANKVDLHGHQEALQALRGAIGAEVLPVSAVSGVGVRNLIARILRVMDELAEREAEAENAPVEL
jgi:GTP-binding protein